MTRRAPGVALASVQVLAGMAGVQATLLDAANMQTALSYGGDVTLDADATVSISDTMLVPSNCRVRLVAGSVLQLFGTYGRTMLRNGNACTTGNLTIGAVFVICADSTTPSGTGQIRTVAAPLRLYYTAPGDTEGAAVDVSAADGKYTLVSSNGKSLYVSVARAYVNAPVTQAVKVVSSCDGARAATWSRNTTTLTVTEAGHSRRTGDCVTLFGATVAGLYFVDSVSGNTWSVPDTRGAGSGSCTVYGSRNIEIACDNGSYFDYDQANRSIVNQSCDAHALIFNSISTLSTPGLRVANSRKYSFYATACAGVTTYGMEAPKTASDGWHINGPARNVLLQGMSGQDGDNLTALGNSDFAPYVINWNADYGSGDVINATIENVRANNNHTELCRLYSTTGKVFRNIVVRNLTGTVDSTTSAITSIVTDTGTPVENAIEINIDGLTIERVDVRRSDGGEVRVFTDISAAAATVGKRKNVILRDITLPSPMGDGANPIVTGRGLIGAIAVAGNYDSLTIERVHARLNLANGFAEWKGTVFNVQNGAVIRSLKISDVKFANNNTLLPTAAFTSIVQTSAGTTITKLLISDVDMQEVNGTGTKAALLYVNQGTIVNAKLLSVANLDGDSIVRVGGSGALNNCTIDDAYANSGSTYLIASDSSANENYCVNNIRGQFNSIFNMGAGVGGTRKFRGSGLFATFASGAGQFNGTFTSITLDVNGPEFVIDLANTALTRAANAGNVVKTKAIAGTIPAGVLAVCDASNAANSWKALHNTALVY